MVARKRNRALARLSILERHTQRRLQSIRATVGCQIFAIEKETTLDLASHSNSPSISIINSERVLTGEDIANLPLQSKLIHLVNLPEASSPAAFLTQCSQFDSTIIIQNENFGASTFVQSVLYGLSQHRETLLAIRFSRWGAARKEWNDLMFKSWIDATKTFSAELGLARDPQNQHTNFINSLAAYIDPNDSHGQLRLAADGCNIILKIRCRMTPTQDFLTSFMALPILAGGYYQQGEFAEFMLIQPQRPTVKVNSGAQIFLMYSPRAGVETDTLEEVG